MLGDNGSYVYRYAAPKEGVSKYYVCMYISGTFNGYNEETGAYDKELYTGDDEESPWLYVELYFNDPTEANQTAYDEIMAQLTEVETAYNDAVEEIKAANPEYELGEWEEIIGGAIDQAKTGAAQALAAANSELEEFFYPFTTEEIENMILEMKNDAFAPINKKAYEDVIAKIEAVEEEYNDAVALIKEVNPSFDLTEWQGIIEKYINDAKTGAEQALNAASADGALFTFAFDGETERGVIAEMNKAAFADPNNKAYKQTVAKINLLISDYEAAVEEIKAFNPGFDFTEWEQIILASLEEKLDAAKVALEVSNEEGYYFKNFFAFEQEAVEEYQNMIAEMKASAGFTGIENIEAEAAAGNVRIFTLDGKSHNAPVKGEINVIVKGDKAYKIKVK